VARSVGPQTPITEFKLCVERIRLEDAQGKPHLHEDAAKKSEDDASTGEIKFTPGLIDLSDGTAKNWGMVDIPVGFALSRLTIKARKDQALCGVDYSVDFNGTTSTEDIEFKWKFDPPVVLNGSTDALQLSLATVTDKLRGDADRNTLGSDLKGEIESTEDSDSKIESKDGGSDHHEGASAGSSSGSSSGDAAATSANP